MSPEVSYARSLLGRQLCGKWRLLRVIGSGGMSTVFEALHRNGRRVAIKVLHPELARRERFRGRFKREAYVANRIDHRDVVQIIDDDVTDDGLAFIVMEYLEGETLGARLKRAGTSLEPADVVSAALRVLDVLAVAHRCGVIHRDIKPDNIFCTFDEGRIKLLDFGIASLRELSAGYPELTEDGLPIGTPAFMAPEQARGLADLIDARTDLWGLGATMFTLLTGRFVHAEGSACGILIAAGSRPAPSLGALSDRARPELVSVVDRALAFEKGDRWTDAAAMREALAAALPSAEKTTFVGVKSSSLAFAQDTLAESGGDRGAPAPGGSQSPSRHSWRPSLAKRARQLAALVAATVIAGILWSQALGFATPVAPPRGRVSEQASRPEPTERTSPALPVSPALVATNEPKATGADGGGSEARPVPHHLPRSASHAIGVPPPLVQAPLVPRADPLDRR